MSLNKSLSALVLVSLSAACGEGAESSIATSAPELHGPLGRLLADLKLQLHEWFAMALCGENESSYLLNLALAELQSPGALRPGLHLLSAASAALKAWPGGWSISSSVAT